MNDRVCGNQPKWLSKRIIELASILTTGRLWMNTISQVKCFGRIEKETNNDFEQTSKLTSSHPNEQNFDVQIELSK